ncbi:SAM-dependent methyltransferase, partial [Nocardia sp. CA2R105]
TVRYAITDLGITQFLDIGTGLPTARNTHQVAQEVNPAARIVYVDKDPLVLAHARALMKSTPEGRTAFIHADLREPESILRDPELTR